MMPFLAAHESAMTIEFIDLNRDQVPGQLILAIVLIVYLGGLFVVSFLASRKIENEEDFLVAGRRLGLFLCFSGLIASWFGGASMTGSSAAARAEGMRGTILDPWAGSITLIIAGIFYAPKLWRMKLLTTADFFRRVYGPKSEMVCSGVQVCGDFGWIAGQYTALAAVQQAYFGIDEKWGVFIAFAIALGYTMIGGMWSVTIIDAIQIVVALGGLLIIAAASFSAFGVSGLDESTSVISCQNFSNGVARFFHEIPGDDLSLLPPHDATMAFIMVYAGTWATGLFGNLPGQDLQQRIFSAKSAPTARAACIWSGIFYLAFALIPVALGLMSRLELPLADAVVDIKVLMYMAGKNMNVYLAVIFVLSFVSIVMSTACSAVLAPATILGHNFLGRITAFQKNKLLRDRICVLLISAGSLVLAFSGESTFGLLDLTLSIALVGLFVPLTMGLYGRPRGELAAILATALGLIAFSARSVPEKFLVPVPEALGPYGTVQMHFDQLKRAMTAADKASSEVVRTKIVEARSHAKTSMQAELTKYVAADRALELTETHFEKGFDWLEFVALRYGAGGKVNLTLQILMALLTISADLYGLGASFAGYFLGQWILKRRGCEWKPIVLESTARE